MLRDPLKETRDPIVPSAMPDFADRMALKVPTKRQGSEADDNRFVWRTLVWTLWLVMLTYLSMMLVMLPKNFAFFVFGIGTLWVSWFYLEKILAQQPMVGSASFGFADLAFAIFAAPLYFLLGGKPEHLGWTFAVGVLIALSLSMLAAVQVAALRLADLRVPVGDRPRFAAFWAGGVCDAGVKETIKHHWTFLGTAICAAFGAYFYVMPSNAPGHFKAIAFFAIIKIIWFMWLCHCEGNVLDYVRASLRGIRSFLTYNLHEAHGLALFQFPERFLWLCENRRLVVVASVLMFVPPLAVAIHPHPDKIGNAIVTYFDAMKIRNPEPVVKPQTVYVPDPNMPNAITGRRVMTNPETAWKRNENFDQQQQEVHAKRAAALDGLVSEIGRIAVSFAAVIILAPLIAFTLFVIGFGAIMLHYERLPKAPATKSTLELVLDHTMTSAVPEERAALYLGQSVYGNHTVFLDGDLFTRPGIIRGKPRTGKTSILESMTYQVLRANAPAHVQWLKANGIPYKPKKVVIVDMKGEDRWLQGTLEECRRLGIRCRVFTLKPGRETCLFNFFSQSRLDEMSTIDFSASLLKGIGLDHDSTGHGVDFWDNMNQIVTVNTLRQNYNLENFHDLYEFLTKGYYQGDKKQIDNASHLVAISQFLSFVPQLNLTEADCADKPGVWDNQIDVPSLLSGRTEVVYFHLDTVTQRKASLAAAKMFVMSLLGAASNRKPGDDADIVAFFDEFQQIVSSNLDDLLAMGTSKGISIILSHQHREQLRETRGVDIRALADACKAWSIHCDWSDQETMKEMIEMAPKARIATLSFNQEVGTVRDFSADGAFSPSRAYAGPMGKLVTVGEKEGPVYHMNELKILSAMPQVAIFRPTVLRGVSVYEDLFPFVWEHHVDRAAATRREKAPWPKNFPGAFLPPLEYSPGKKHKERDETGTEAKLRRAAKKKGGKS